MNDEISVHMYVYVHMYGHAGSGLGLRTLPVRILPAFSIETTSPVLRHPLLDPLHARTLQHFTAPAPSQIMNKNKKQVLINITYFSSMKRKWKILQFASGVPPQTTIGKQDPWKRDPPERIRNCEDIDTRLTEMFSLLNHNNPPNALSLSLSLSHSLESMLPLNPEP